MEHIVIPRGYTFVPTEQVLILNYLKPFLQGKQHSFPNVPIHRVNIYEYDPEQLSRDFKKGNAKEWFFITERTKKIEGGKMQIRNGNGGYWKRTQVPKGIEAGDGVIGYRAGLAYHIRREPSSVQSDWLMYEYWCDSDDDNKKLVDYALCKIYLTPQAAKEKAEEEEGEEARLILEALRKEIFSNRSSRSN